MIWAARARRIIADMYAARNTITQIRRQLKVEGFEYATADVLEVIKVYGLKQGQQQAVRKRGGQQRALRSKKWREQ